MIMQFKNIIKEIDNGRIQQIYFLKGEDQYLQIFFINRLLFEITKKNKVEKNYLSPNEYSSKEIIDIILSNNLFSDNKLLVIRDPQQLKGKSSKELLEYCSSPKEGNFLVMINDNYFNNSSFMKNIEKIITPINTSTPEDIELYKWANYFFRQNKRKATKDVIKNIIENYGDSVYSIKNEIDKLCLISEKELIDIDELVLSSWIKNRQKWEFFAAIGDKNIDHAIFLSKKIIGKNHTMISLIYTLTVFFQEMLFIKINSGTFISSRRYIPLPEKIKNNLVKFARNYAKNEIENSLNLLRDIEKKQKTSKRNDETDIIQFLYGSIR